MFTKKELAIIADELNRKLEEYENFHDINDEKYLKSIEIIVKKAVKYHHTK